MRMDPLVSLYYYAPVRPRCGAVDKYLANAAAARCVRS